MTYDNYTCSDSVSLVMAQVFALFIVILGVILLCGNGEQPRCIYVL